MQKISHNARGGVLVWVVLAIVIVGGGYLYLAQKPAEVVEPTTEITEDNIAPPHDYEYDPVEEEKKNEAQAPVSTTPAPKPVVTKPAPAPAATTGTGSASEPTPTTTPATTSEPVIEEAPKNDNFVTYTADGFVPKVATITLIECTPGNTNCEENNTTIKFTNDSPAQMWVASDPYPTHYYYYDFDQHTSVSRGGWYQFTFPKKAGTYTYHNHSNPLHTGTIIIK